ncbi:MAG: DUF1223 domain-containing protein, partial [Acidobacteriales bacterium]|nr:DUF1223 domain-containing protein [Terriglobales bacterium]
VEADALAAGGKGADLYFVVALNHASSDVASGENGGRRLSHVAVVQSLTRVAALQANKATVQDVSVKLPSGDNAKNLRVIAFVQEPEQGKVLGATMNAL